MRHRVKKTFDFNHKPGQHSRSVLRNLATSFFLHKSLVTTEKRAKALSILVDRMVRAANTADSSMKAIRDAMAVLYTEVSSRELVERVAPKFKDRPSGCTRITPIKYRDGDSAKLVKIEFVA
ncbi:MAG TPA: 50S ribosomal protein L17 [bacterium]|nr:50S ribosomal protein L17 [bacterium]